MFQPRKRDGGTRALDLLIAVSSAAVIAVLGLQSPARAAPSTATAPAAPASAPRPAPSPSNRPVPRPRRATPPASPCAAPTSSPSRGCGPPRTPPPASARRPAERLRPAGRRRRRPDRRHRRRLRRPQRRGRPGRLPRSSSACPPAPRPTAASARSTSAAAPTTRPPTPAGPARSRSTSTWSPRSRPTRTSCWSRPTTTASTTSAPRSTRRSRWAPSTSPTATAPATQHARQRRGPAEVTDLDPHYNHPGVAVVASSGDGGYGVVLPGRLAVRHPVGGTTLVRDPAAPAAGPSRCGTTRSAAPAAAARSTSPSRPCRPTPAAPSAPSPTSPRSPTRRPASRSTRPTATAAGRSTAAPAPSSPIIAGVYADAGTPVAGTYPNSYPYADRRRAQRRHHRAATARCTPAYLCTAGAGYDGPTGLGTPNGLAAFTTGPHGELTGTVTDAATGSADRRRHRHRRRHDRAPPTRQGTTRWPCRSARYDVTAAAFGYATGTAAGVTVTDGGTRHRELRADAGAHARPSPARSPTAPATAGRSTPRSPSTACPAARSSPTRSPAHYSLTLPQGATYTLHVDRRLPRLPAGRPRPSTVGTTDATANVAVPVDAWRLHRPRLRRPPDRHHRDVRRHHHAGRLDASPTPTAPPAAGSSTTRATAATSPAAPAASPSSTATTSGTGDSQDTYLISPGRRLHRRRPPRARLRHRLPRARPAQTADVDVSADGGATWTTSGTTTTGRRPRAGPRRHPAAGYAGKTGVRVRFHYTGTWAGGGRSTTSSSAAATCDPVPGGLVVGMVTDANTGAGVDGATSPAATHPATHATTRRPRPDDPNLGDGFYWMFSPLTGKHPLDRGEVATTPPPPKTVNVAADSTVTGDFSSRPASSRSPRRRSTRRSAGAEQATQTADRQEHRHRAGHRQPRRAARAASTLAASRAARRCSGSRAHYSALAAAARRTAGAEPAAAPAPADAAGRRRLETVADLPDGRSRTTRSPPTTARSTRPSASPAAPTPATCTSYDPDSRQLDPAGRAPPTPGRPRPHGFIDGKLYAVGGWGADGSPGRQAGDLRPADQHLDAPAPPRPSRTPAPAPRCSTASCTSVGGCDGHRLRHHRRQVYDPATDSWSHGRRLPGAGRLGVLRRPSPASSTAPAAPPTPGSISHAYVYDPAPTAGRRSPTCRSTCGARRTPRPTGCCWSPAASASGDALTNQGFAYDPPTGTWTRAAERQHRRPTAAAAPLGFYKVGGLASDHGVPANTVELLPGYDQAGRRPTSAG